MGLKERYDDPAFIREYVKELEWELAELHESYSKAHRLWSKDTNEIHTLKAEVERLKQEVEVGRLLTEDINHRKET